MSVLRFSALALAIGLGTPALAQTAPAAKAQTTGPDIVVRGETERKPGDWKRAESDHVIVYGQNSIDELIKVTTNLEQLYALMSRLYRRGQTDDQTVKPQILLVDTAEHFRAMGLQNARSEEGPYTAPFQGERYYDPRPDGDVIAIPRVNLYLDLNTNRAANVDCDEKAEMEDADGDQGPTLCGAVSVFHQPAIRTWQQNVYSAFAEHFMLTYHPLPYPRWYIDGIGALFSTIQAHDSGSVDYALPPDQLRQVFRSYFSPAVIDVLAGRAPVAGAKKVAWTPYHAWLMAYYFTFGAMRTERAAQFQHYMQAIGGGASLEEAAKAFANPVALQREVMGNVVHEMAYAQGAKSQVRVSAPVVTPITDAQAALVEARFELGADQTPAPVGASSSAPVGPTARFDADALVFAAQSACHIGDAAACLADAEQVLTHQPENVDALTCKGTALVSQAAHSSEAARPAQLAAARDVLRHAITADPTAPMPRIAYFESFTRMLEPAPDDAVLGMGQAIRAVPAAPGPRLALAEELLRQGKADVARRVAFSVLYGPYDSPERRTAQALFPPMVTQAVVTRRQPAG